MATSTDQPSIDQYSRPTKNQLREHVSTLVCTEWYDLGLELLDSKNEKVLDIIETNHKIEGVQICCRKMFDEWLKSDNVSWDKLVAALRKINQHHAASEIEKLFKSQTTVPAESVRQPEASVPKDAADNILITKPEMWQLNKIVVPQVMAHWEDVAYTSLHYDIPTVEGIIAKHKGDPKKCCQELFKDWLSTDRGVGPKTWKVLLKQLKEVSELTASVEKITEQLPSCI